MQLDAMIRYLFALRMTGRRAAIRGIELVTQETLGIRKRQQNRPQLEKF
jgi:hypothetical protein